MTRHALPPGPVTRFPAKHVIAIARDMLGFARGMARDYGDIVHLETGRGQSAYIISHPDHVREVLVTQQKSFMKGRSFERIKRLLGNGLLTSEGDFHLRQRRLAQPAFHRQRIAAYAATMSEHAARMRDRWRDGETLDVSQEMMRLTLAVAAKTLFDADVESEAGEIGAALTEAISALNIAIIPYSELLDKLPLPIFQRFRRARERLDATIYRIIEERRRSGSDRGDLLSMLLMARDTDGDSGRMTDDQLRDEIVTIFIAGHETSALALTWAWYRLAQDAGDRGATPRRGRRGVARRERRRSASYRGRFAAPRVHATHHRRVAAAVPADLGGGAARVRPTSRSAATRFRRAHSC